VKNTSCLSFGRLFFAGLLMTCGLVCAQSPSPAARPPVSGTQTSSVNQLTPQVLGEMLRSASTFHELVENMNLGKSFGADQHVQGADGRFHHPIERTAQTIGAGAGAGAAVGAMTHSQNGVLIGALVGGAGGLIIDEILKHREETAERASRDTVPEPANAPRGFKERDPGQLRQTN
jgi:hypothetical protein